MANYWEDREAEAQAALTRKNTKEIEKQLLKYYDISVRNLRGQFLSTYNHLLSRIEKGHEPTPADLYKLNKYWELQGDIQHELKKLGDKEIQLFQKNFMQQWEEIYNIWAAKDDIHYSKMDYQAAALMISEIWCADGLSWSERVWTNTSKLQEALNDELINCVLTGKSPKQLRERLMYQFNVSYGRADSLVRTELAHIQTKAAEQRYMDMGVKYIQIYADKDERRCDVCGKLHTKVYVLGRDKIPIPAHTNCRCTIIPVTKPQEGRMAGLLQLDKGK